MNQEYFEQLPEEKKTLIEKAYFAAVNKQISPGDFFSICRKTLNDYEYSHLFNQTEQSQTKQNVNLAQNQQSSQQSQMPPQQEEIKTEHIEDIMQYSGVDLKEEAEKIVKEAEYNISARHYDDVDQINQMDSLFDVEKFKEYVYRICAAKNMKISEDGLRLLFLVIRRKLLDFTDKLDAASAIRTEAELKDYSFKIDNELSKQLWYLNELEKGKMEKLMLKKDEDPKKKKVIQEREDLMIKKKQSNTVAMAAMGIKQRSWMTNDQQLETDESTKFSPIYAPFDEKGFDNKINNRIINMKDFIYVLERDKRYNKSIFLIQHYFK